MNREYVGKMVIAHHVNKTIITSLGINTMAV